MAQGDAVYTGEEGLELPMFVYDTSGTTLAIGILKIIRKMQNFQKARKQTLFVKLTIPFHGQDGN